MADTVSMGIISGRVSAFSRACDRDGDGRRSDGHVYVFYPPSRRGKDRAFRTFAVHVTDMMGSLPIPASAAFEALVRGSQFRDVIAVPVAATPQSIFRALRQVTLQDMKLAWLLGELRYLPSRLAGRLPAVDQREPFLGTLLKGGTLILFYDPPRELITGSAAQLHRVHQAPRRFASREAFEAFDDADHEKLFMSVRVVPTGRPGEQWLVLEHATRALSAAAELKFRRYWRVIKPLGAFVTRQLLRAVGRRAERLESSTPQEALWLRSHHT
jgi:hypothetical protein